MQPFLILTHDFIKIKLFFDLAKFSVILGVRSITKASGSKPYCYLFNSIVCLQEALGAFSLSIFLHWVLFWFWCYPAMDWSPIQEETISLSAQHHRQGDKHRPFEAHDSEKDSSYLGFSYFSFYNIKKWIMLHKIYLERNKLSKY